jgi:hypothetical protein
MSRFRNWVGPATRDPGTARPTRPTTLHNTYGQQLAALVELIRSGQAFTEPTTAERLLLPLVGVLTQVHQEHQVDNYGRCSICRATPRAWRPWPRRTACTVHAALAYHMSHAATTDPRRTP